MKTLKILIITFTFIAMNVMGVKANAETLQELNNRTIYNGSNLTKAVQAKYQAMNLDYLTESELKEFIQADINYFKTSPNAEIENANADGSQIITMYKENGKYFVVLGKRPTYVEPMEVNEVKEAEPTEEIEPASPETIEVIENDTNTDFEPRVVFDAQTEEKAKQEQDQYKSLFPLSGLWYLLKHYPLQTAGSIIVMLLCLVELGKKEVNRKNGSNNGSGKGDNQ